QLTSGYSLGSSSVRLRIDANQLQVSEYAGGGDGDDAYILNTDGDLTVKDSAVTGTFDLRVDNGNLLSFGNASGDVRAANVKLAVPTSGKTIGASTNGVGTAGPFLIDATTLTRASTGDGDIFLRDMGGDFPLDLIQAGGSHAVDLNTTVGAITHG